MRVLRIFIILVAFVSSVLFFSLVDISVRAQQEDPKLKILEWNIGTYFHMPKPERIPRMQTLADVIVEQNADIVYLEEFNNKVEDIYAGDLHYLLESLATRGYPMYAHEVKYSEPGNSDSRMVLLSKWPFDVSTLRTISIRDEGGARATQSIYTRGTPIGDIRLSNIHTHIQYQLSDFITFVDEYYLHDPQDSVLGGDLNISITSDDIPRRLREIIDTSCRNEPCVKGQTIESIFTFKDSNFYIDQRFPIGNISGISDQHSALVAFVGTTQPLPTPTPPPPADACTLVSGPTVACNDAGTLATISWDYSNANFELGKITVRIDNRSDSWYTEGSDFFMASFDESQKSIGVGVIPNVEYAYRVDAYKDPSDSYPYGICTMNDPMTGGRTRRERRMDVIIDVDQTDISFTCVPKVPVNSPDLNNNGTVDIFDYNMLIGVFGTTSCEHNLTGDTCTIDIFDYSALVETFGESVQ